MSELAALARPEVLALKAYESARSLVTEGVVFLDANESPTGEHGLNRYPEPQPRALVERFVELYGVARERIVIGRGSDEAIDLLVRAFCRPKDDAILICPPTYGVYEIAAAIQDARVVRVPLVERGSSFALDEEAIAGALETDRGVKILFLCSPNNPTGTAFAPEVLERIAGRARGRALVVVDEAYAEFSGERSLLPKLEALPNLVVLRTLSKAWALAGARCGVAVGSPELASLLHKVRAPYPLSLPAVDAALAATDGAARSRLPARVQELRRAREELSQALRSLGGTREIFASSANFVLVRFREPSRVMAAAREAGIILRDRSREPGLAGCVRITVGTAAENAALLAALRKAGL